MTDASLPGGIPAHVFADRRTAVYAALGNGVLVLPAAPVRFRSRDTEYRYRPDSELHYVSGATEAGTVAVLSGGATPRFTIFARERDADAELWAGPRLGPEGAGERYAADEAFPLGELADRLPAMLQAADRVFFRAGGGGEIERFVGEAMEHARSRGARTGSGPRAVVDPGEILDEPRMTKDEYEIALIRRACEVTLEGHRAGISAVAPGVGEWVVEAAVNGAFRRAGAAGPGFETIVASGPNACVLHYVDNGRTVGEGDLVLLDAGAEYGLYHGDVTRTVPASGRFTAEQRAVYEIVEDARSKAVAAVKPGVAVSDVHAVAVATIVEGLVALGVIPDDPDPVKSPAAHRDFFPHQTTHWLGLDVHDPGDYVREGLPRMLRPGMVLTVEPGIYLRPGPAVPDALQGIGVRIEDDVLVTDDGHENLTAALPTAPDDVEGLVGRGG